MPINRDELKATATGNTAGKGFTPETANKEQSPPVVNQEQGFYSEQTSQASTALTSISQGMRGAVSKQLVNANAYLTQVAEQQNAAADHIAEQIATLHDPNYFMALCYGKAVEKMGDRLTQEVTPEVPFGDYGTVVKPVASFYLPSATANKLKQLGEGV